MEYSYLITIFILLLMQELLNSQSIPAKYLLPDEKPTGSDLDLYLDRLLRLTESHSTFLNITDGSNIVGHNLISSLLIRTLRDYKHKLDEVRISKIKEILRVSDNYITHMTWIFRQKERSLSELRQTQGILANSIKDFNTKLLPKYLLTTALSEFSPYYDDLSLPKEYYAKLSKQYFNRKYPIIASDSDKCIRAFHWNTVPGSADMPMRQCKAPEVCFEKVYQNPSVAYNLSHRLLNQLLYLMSYRCYLRSEKEDYENVHTMCAEMYREAIYTARRGFFARDMFFEHVALCSLVGYEEMHRRQWFLKTASLIDDEGCVKEFDNFTINRTAIKPHAQSRKKLAKILAEPCQSHVMAVGGVVMAAAIRHVAHHLE